MPEAFTIEIMKAVFQHRRGGQGWQVPLFTHLSAPPQIAHRQGLQYLLLSLLQGRNVFLQHRYRLNNVHLSSRLAGNRGWDGGIHGRDKSEARVKKGIRGVMESEKTEGKDDSSLRNG